MDKNYEDCWSRNPFPSYLYLGILILVFNMLLPASGYSQEVLNLDFGSNGKITYQLEEGQADVYVDDKLIIDDFIAETVVDQTNISSVQYSEASIEQEEINDDYGSGIRTVIRHEHPDLPQMDQIFYTYNNLPYFFTEFQIRNSEGEISSNYMAPVKSEYASISAIGDNNILFVPYDNDAWVRYNAKSMQGTMGNVSSEVSAFYEDQSREGLVMGSVEQTDWKTGVKTQGSNNILDELEIWGGYTDASVTRDNRAHGKVKGEIVKSPKVFIGLFEDWRLGMEKYGEAVATEQPRYIFDWDEPTPFVWNSWGAIQTDLSYENATEVTEFIADSLPKFRSGETVYIDLDSYWDNMVEGGLEGNFDVLKNFVTYCKERGLTPGIYWAPFVDWGKYDRRIEGSNYQYSDAWTLVNNDYYELADSRAMDPTHPGTKERINLVIDKFIDTGFEMLKVDFIIHAGIEADEYYESDITTGMQAFRHGMEYLVDRTDGEMLLNVAISPNLATGPFAHTRRIACDAYASINDTEYTLNSTTYGWWQSKIYNYLDADHIVFANESIEANRARLTSGIVNGMVTIGDDYSKEGAHRQRAIDLLGNEELLEVAKLGKTFRPVEGDKGQSASELFLLQEEGANYLAIINYGGDKQYNIPFERLGLANGLKCVKELFSGKRFSTDEQQVQVFLKSQDAVLLELNASQENCLFSLPTSNYKVGVKDATCYGKLNGSIAVEVEDTEYNYQVKINEREPVQLPQEGEDFSYKLEGLSAGVYEVCFSIPDKPDYEQCFEVSVEEPELMEAVTNIDAAEGIMNVNLKGPESFELSLNGKRQTLEAGNHEIVLNPGMNEISISGEKPCQGSSFEQVYVSEEIKLYPNPTHSKLQVKIPNTSEEVSLQVFNILGASIMEVDKIVKHSGVVEIEVSSLKAGTYLLKIKHKYGSETIKFVKK